MLAVISNSGASRLLALHPNFSRLPVYANVTKVIGVAFGVPGAQVGKSSFLESARAGFKIALPVNLPAHSAFSSSFRDTAVTSLRGLIRNDSASNQLRKPEMTSVLPAITPR